MLLDTNVANLVAIDFRERYVIYTILLITLEWCFRYHSYRILVVVNFAVRCISLVVRKPAFAQVVQMERKHEHHVHTQPIHSSQQLIVFIRYETQSAMQWWFGAWFLCTFITLPSLHRYHSEYECQYHPYSCLCVETHLHTLWNSQKRKWN